MRIKSLIASAVMLGLIATGYACAQQADKAADAKDSGGIAWVGFDEGMAKARAEGKPVMVDFYTTWCKYCKMLDDTTYKDAEIVDILNREFVAIKINAESSDKVTDKGKEMTMAELAKAYQVSGYPTIFFFDGKGEPIGPLPGYNAPAEFKPVLTYITSGAHSKGVTYADYLESLKK